MPDRLYTIASDQELEQVITDLEQYRAKIVAEVLRMTKKIRASKPMAREQLQANPEIRRVDTVLKHLRSHKVVEMSRKD